MLAADGTSGDRLTVRSGDRLTVRSYNVGDGRLPTNQRRENALDRPLAVWPRGTSSASRGVPTWLLLTGALARKHGEDIVTCFQRWASRSYP